MTADAGSIAREYQNTVSELEAVRNIPLCRDCIFFSSHTKTGGLFGRDKTSWRCRLTRHDPLWGGLIGNSDAREMRLTGPCGPDGKLFKGRQS